MLKNINKRTLDPYLSGKAEWKNAKASILLSLTDTLEIDPHTLAEGKVQNKYFDREKNTKR